MKRKPSPPVICLTPPPEDEERQRALYRELTMQTHTLVIFEGVDEAADLHALAPAAPSSALVVGSLDPQDIPPDWTVIRLGPMVLSDAVAVLRRDAPDIDAGEARRIAQRLGRDPTSMSIASRLLLEGVSVDDVAPEVTRMRRRAGEEPSE